MEECLPVPQSCSKQFFTLIDDSAGLGRRKGEILDSCSKKYGSRVEGSNMVGEHRVLTNVVAGQMVLTNMVYNIVLDKTGFKCYD